MVLMAAPAKIIPSSVLVRTGSQTVLNFQKFENRELEPSVLSCSVRPVPVLRSSSEQNFGNTKNTSCDKWMKDVRQCKIVFPVPSWQLLITYVLSSNVQYFVYIEADTSHTTELSNASSLNLNMSLRHFWCYPVSWADRTQGMAYLC